MYNNIICMHQIYVYITNMCTIKLYVYIKYMYSTNILKHKTHVAFIKRSPKVEESSKKKKQSTDS